MVQKTTIAVPADKSGAISVNVFHIYSKGRKRIGYVGDFIKTSVRGLDLNTKVKKKSKHVSIFIRSAFRYVKNDGMITYSDLNSVVLLKKRLTPVGKEIYGPIYNTVRRKKFLSSFPGVI